MSSEVSTGFVIAMPPCLAGSDRRLVSVSFGGGRSIRTGINFIRIRSSSGWSRLLIVGVVLITKDQFESSPLVRAE